MCCLLLIPVWLTNYHALKKHWSHVSISNPCKKQILVDCIWWLFEPLLVLNSNGDFKDTSFDPHPWGNHRMWLVYFSIGLKTTTYMAIQSWFDYDDDDLMILCFDDHDDYDDIMCISCASHHLNFWFRRSFRNNSQRSNSLSWMPGVVAVIRWTDAGYKGYVFFLKLPCDIGWAIWSHGWCIFFLNEEHFWTT